MHELFPHHGLVGGLNRLASRDHFAGHQFDFAEDDGTVDLLICWADMANSLLFTGFYTYVAVQDFYQQQDISSFFDS